VLLGDALGALAPPVADRAQCRGDDLLDRRLDIVEGERLLDERGQLPRVWTAHRCDDRIPEAALRGGSRRGVVREQRSSLTDPVSVGEPVTQPLDACDVALVIPALAARRATRMEDAIAPLPFPQRVGADAGASRDRCDVEALRSRRGAFRPSLDVGDHGRSEVLERRDLLLVPSARLGGDRTECASRQPRRAHQRHAEVPNRAEIPRCRQIAQHGVCASVLDHERPPRQHGVLADRISQRGAALVERQPRRGDPACEEQLLPVGDVDHRDRHVEQGADEPGQPIEDLPRRCVT